MKTVHVFPRGLLAILALTAAGCVEEETPSTNVEPVVEDIEPNTVSDAPAEDPLGQSAAGLGQPEPATSEQNVIVEREVTTEPLATGFGWTPYTSEENPPISCEGASMVGQFGCSGDYCDNVRMYCNPTAHAGQDAYWTVYFSEEGSGGNYRYCAANYWMVGVACSGRYCDNLSLLCRYFPTAIATDCFWTGWMSEESGGTLRFPSNYYARGMQCDGDYCDNKRFYACAA